ncbi:MAG: EAL domain-containing protein [Leptolyngbya sp.]|nr:EAL domain-containing protein [Leptolyngbya sp.]
MKASLKRLNHFLRQVVLPRILYQSETQSLATGGKIIVISSLLAGIAITGLKVLQVLEPAELFIFDRIVRSLPDQDLNPRITIIGLSEGDLRQYGWPLSDDQLASLMATLQAHQPRVVGLDLYRSTFRPPGTEALVDQLALPNVITIENVGSTPGLEEVPPPPTVERERVGFNDFPTDLDGIIRRNLLFVGRPPDGYYSFGLRVVLADNQRHPLPLQTDQNHLYLGDIPIRVLSGADGGYQAVDSSGYQILLRYPSRHQPSRQLSMSQVLSGQFDPDWITDQVVLIGTTAASLKDRFYTPFSFSLDEEMTMAGVVIHAQMVSQLLDLLEGKSSLYRYLPAWSEGLWLLGWCLATGGLVWGLKRPSLMLGSSLVLLLGVSTVGVVAVHHLIWLPIAEPMVGIITTTATVIAYKLLYRSTHDPLTGLPNREAFLTLIQKALRQHQGDPEADPVIVVFMGIDRFKVINESLGHQAGDQVLRVIAKRLTQSMPMHARAARVGGDEFTLMLTNLSNEAAGERMDALQYTLSEPIILQGQKLPSAISMGMAISQPGMAHKPADLLRDAHTAMYRAKALGKSRFEVFAMGMLTEAVNRLQLESDLLSALDNQEFLLYYQPIIRLATGELAGFEALVRWHQRDRGFVLPSAFIPAAEETGLIMALGQWIFREACRQLHAWHQMFPQYPNLTMSINLSNRQFGQSDLISQMKMALRETQVRGDCVRLEITESMVMGDVDAAIDLMLKLKSLDLKLAIDDFGTGYSSLSYLHRFPMDTLKVDKSFVGRLEKSNEDRAIIHTILTLGQQLGMEVVAEGVETLEQANMLKQEQCDYGQGYFFAKPLPREEAQALIQRHCTQTV